MKKIINIIKKNIFGVIIGGIIFGSIGVFAANKFYAKDVSINTPTGSSLESNATLQDSLDELYSIADNKINNNYSTDEVKSGVWIDGKQIYKKTLIIKMDKDNSEFRSLNFTYNSENAVEAYVQGFSLKDLNISTFISSYGIALTDNNVDYVPYPVVYTARAFLNGWYNSESKYYNIRIGKQYYESGGITLYLTIEYTKQD